MVRHGAPVNHANWILHTLLLIISPALFLQILLVLICNENLVRARVVTADGAVNINSKSSTTSESESVTDRIPISISFNSIPPLPSLFHDLILSEPSAQQFWRTKNKHNNGSSRSATVLLYPDQSVSTNTSRVRHGSVNNTSTSTRRFRDVPQAQSKAKYRSKNLTVDVSFPRTFPSPITSKQAREQKHRLETASEQDEENVPTRARARSRELAKTKGWRTIVSKSSSIIHDLGGRESTNGNSVNPGRRGKSQRNRGIHELNLNDSESFTSTSDNDIYDHGYDDGAPVPVQTTTAQIFTRRTRTRTREKRSSSSGGYFNQDKTKANEDYEKSLRLFLFLGGLAISFFILIFLTTMLCFCCPFCLIAKRARRTTMHGGSSGAGSLGGSGAIFQSTSGPETTFTVTPASGGRSASIQMNTSPLLGTGTAAAGAERRASTFQQFHQQRMSQDLGVSLLTAALPRSPRPSTSQQGARLSVSGYNVLPYGFDPAVLPSTPSPQSQAQQPEPMPPPPQQFAQTQTDSHTQRQTYSQARGRGGSTSSRAS